MFKNVWLCSFFFYHFVLFSYDQRIWIAFHFVKQKKNQKWTDLFHESVIGFCSFFRLTHFECCHFIYVCRVLTILWLCSILLFHIRIMCAFTWIIISVFFLFEKETRHTRHWGYRMNDCANCVCTVCTVHKSIKCIHFLSG